MPPPHSSSQQQLQSLLSFSLSLSLFFFSLSLSCSLFLFECTFFLSFLLPTPFPHEPSEGKMDTSEEIRKCCLLLTKVLFLKSAYSKSIHSLCDQRHLPVTEENVKSVYLSILILQLHKQAATSFVSKNSRKECICKR
jgi:hypothetical protein